MKKISSADFQKFLAAQPQMKQKWMWALLFQGVALGVTLSVFVYAIITSDHNAIRDNLFGFVFYIVVVFALFDMLEIVSFGLMMQKRPGAIGAMRTAFIVNGSIATFFLFFGLPFLLSGAINMMLVLFLVGYVIPKTAALALATLVHNHSLR